MPPTVQTYKFDADSPQETVDLKRRNDNRINIFTCLSIVFLVLGVAGLSIVLGMYFASRVAPKEYGIVIDAGSSHSSLYVYEWDSTRVGNTGKVMELAECEADGKGLSEFVDNPLDAGSSLKKCVNDATKDIPSNQREYAPLYLGATAGMRLIRLRNSTLSDEIMNSVRNELTKSSFELRDPQQQVKIISGKDEGIGLWLTANYVGGNLGDILEPNWHEQLPQGNSTTVGILDLGGASTQIAFAVDKVDNLPANVSEKITIFGSKLKVFSDSYLCYGAGEMRGQLLAILAQAANYSGTVEHPCFARGFSQNLTYGDVFGKSPCTDNYSSPKELKTEMTLVGTGNNSECTNLVSKIFVSSPNCSRSPNCSFNGRPLGFPLPDAFLARGAFAYALKDLDALDDNKQTTYGKFTQKMNSWCEINYTEISKMDMYDPSVVCTNAHYTEYLLDKVYKFSKELWSKVKFTNKLGDVSMGWTLGYMTNITSSTPNVPNLKLFYISLPVFVIVVVIANVCILIGIIFIALAIQFRRKSYSEFRTSTSESY